VCVIPVICNTCNTSSPPLAPSAAVPIPPGKPANRHGGDVHGGDGDRALLWEVGRDRGQPDSTLGDALAMEYSLLPRLACRAPDFSSAPPSSSVQEPTCHGVAAMSVDDAALHPEAPPPTGLPQAQGEECPGVSRPPLPRHTRSPGQEGSEPASPTGEATHQRVVTERVVPVQVPVPVPVREPVFVDRLVERVVHVPVQVPVHVPLEVRVPFEVRVPYEVHVPYPIYVPVPQVGTPTAVHNMQFNTLFAGTTPAGLLQGHSVPAITAPPSMLAIEAANRLLLQAPPAGSDATAITELVDKESPEEAVSQASRKKRKYTRLADWPAEWRDKYEEWKAAMNDPNKPHLGRSLCMAWDQDLQQQVWFWCGPQRR